MKGYIFDFFFQAEDGIRDVAVTGVQTCALPIWNRGLVGVARHPDALRGVDRQPQGPDQDLSIGRPWNSRLIAEKFFSGQFPRGASVQNPLAVLTAGHAMSS